MALGHLHFFIKRYRLYFNFSESKKMPKTLPNLECVKAFSKLLQSGAIVLLQSRYIEKDSHQSLLAGPSSNCLWKKFTRNRRIWDGQALQRVANNVKITNRWFGPKNVEKKFTEPEKAWQTKIFDFASDISIGVAKVKFTHPGTLSSFYNRPKFLAEDIETFFSSVSFMFELKESSFGRKHLGRFWLFHAVLQLYVCIYLCSIVVISQ